MQTQFHSNLPHKCVKSNIIVVNASIHIFDNPRLCPLGKDGGIYSHLIFKHSLDKISIFSLMARGTEDDCLL
jgi:hypothetical protein